MSQVIIPAEGERITHGFGIEDTEDGTFRRVSVAKRANGRFTMKLETRGPQDAKMNVLRFNLSARGLAMLAQVVDEAQAKMHTHPVHDAMKDF